MAVLLDTSVGELVIDLFVNECPIASTNFLKLCKMKYYNGCLFYNVQSNFIAQTGDPTGTGKGGISVFGLLDKAKPTFRDEINKQRKLNKVGLVLMAHSANEENSNRSQFFITLRSDDMYDFEGKYTVLGEVAEGMEILEKLNDVYCDQDGRPYQDIRIRHTAILDDPIADPAGLSRLIPSESPQREWPAEETVKRRLRYEDDLDQMPAGKTESEIEVSIKKKEAQSRAVVLEMTGDLPDADAKPPVEVLFICKLNPITRDEDLELIFSRFGIIKSCEIIRDFKTGDSLNYAFIEFDSESACIEAYQKMNNVLIDDRRIKVDFSQSVSHLWNRFLLRPRNARHDDKTGHKAPTAPPTASVPPIAPHKPSHSTENASSRARDHDESRRPRSKERRHRSRSHSRERRDQGSRHRSRSRERRHQSDADSHRRR